MSRKPVHELSRKQGLHSSSPPPPPPVSLFQLFRYCQTSDRVLVVLGAAIAVITGFSWNLLTIAFGDVVDVFVRHEMALRTNASSNETHALFMSDVYFFSGSLVVLWVANTVCNYLILVLFPLTAINQIRAIKVKYFAAVLRQDMTWFDTTTTSGDFASRVTTDLKRIEDGLNEKMGLAIYNASTAFIAIATAFVYGWKLTLVIISLLPFLAFGTSVMNKVQATFARKEVEAYALAGGVAEEVISSIRTVLAFGGQSREVARYERHLSPALRSGIRRNLMTGVGNGLMFSCLYAGLALGIWFGVQMILEDGNHYSIGTIVIVFWCVSGAGFSIGGAAPHFEAISVAMATAARVFAIIERRPQIDVLSESGLRPEVVEGDIEFREVYFAYPSRPEVNVLNGFTLRVRPGESVALVGASGSGKSTVVQLLERFYDPSGGAVVVDGLDVRDWHVGYLRQQMGVVGQEPILFDTTIAENIALGSHLKFVDHKDVEVAVTEANADHFIARLPLGYDTYVGDRGAQMSGGQKQRIAIARALINRPKILLLDEATSALDLQSEAKVQEALERACRGRTTIIIAHRLSTIANCNRIVFVESGRVREEGTHRELMDRKGAYFDLVRRQEMSQQEGEENTTHGDTPTATPTTATAIEDEDNDIEGEEGLDIEEKKLKKFSQRRLLRLLSADKHYIIVGLVLSLLYGLIVPIYAYIFGAFVEVFATTDSAQDIWNRSHVFAYYYVVIAVAVGAISVTQMTALGVAGERLTMRLRRMAFEAIVRQEISWFDRRDNSSGALCARLSADAANVQGASGSRMAIICQALSTFLASAVLGFWLNWQLSAIASLFIPFILMGAAVSASVDNWELKTSKQSMALSTKVAVEAIAGIRTVAALNREKHFCLQFAHIVESNAKTATKKTILRAITLSFSLSIVFLSYAVVFLYGGVLLASGRLESGAFFIIIETLIYGSMTVGQSSVFTSDYRKAKMAAANIFRLIDRKSTTAKEGVKERPLVCNGNITFRGVHFHYPSRPEANILTGLSVEVRAGETVALVGASGCGKSTSVQLLQKFYDVTKGSILIDGHSVDTLDTDWLRSQTAVVSQEPNLFSYTIRENIAYGDNSRDVPFVEVVRAAQNAAIHDFISELPLGYETPVGPRGAQLSGGQKQRIAIARALVRNPRVLLLDEATSALDTASEHVVQKALDSAARGRTTLVVAHRLSTIRHAHKIVVMSKGRAVEEGKHEELMALKGTYHNLYSLCN